jgi:hypothetical protein
VETVPKGRPSWQWRRFTASSCDNQTGGGDAPSTTGKWDRNRRDADVRPHLCLEVLKVAVGANEFTSKSCAHWEYLVPNVVPVTGLCLIKDGAVFEE